MLNKILYFRRNETARQYTVPNCHYPRSRDVVCLDDGEVYEIETNPEKRKGEIGINIVEVH